MTTPKTSAPEWAASQAAPYTTVNEALRRIEAGSGLFRVEDDDATAPPGACADGAQYIPAAVATGAWAGHEKAIAIAVGVNAANGWYFVAPEEGMRARIKDENVFKEYDGASWVSAAAGTGDLLAANNLSDVASAATSRTNLGATTIGGNVFTLANPGAITFLRVNADNSVSALSAASFRTAIGAGTGSGSGDLLSTNNLSDLANAATARTNLGLGTSATGNTGTAGAVVPLLNGANTHSGLATFSAGADLTPAAAPSTTAVGYLGAPQSLGLDSGNVTLAMTDAGKHVYHTDANARDLTIPANSSVAFPIGTVIAGVNENGAGVVTLKITTDTLRWGSSTGQRTIAANATFSLLKVAATVWRLTGDGIT